MSGADQAQGASEHVLESAPPPAQPVDDGPVMFWGLALMGATAAFVARALAPALRGVWVGTDWAIDLVQMVAAFATQLFAVSLAAVTVGAISAVWRTGLTLRLKLAALLGGGVSVFAVMISSAARLNRLLAFVYGSAAVAAAFYVAWKSVRRSRLRPGAMVVGMMSLAGVARLLSLVSFDLVQQGHIRPVFGSVSLVDVTATVAYGLEVVGVGAALTWLAKNSRRPRLLFATVAACAVGAVGFGVAATAMDASGVQILVGRLLRAVLVGPAPVVGLPLRVMLEAGAWVALFVVLSHGARGRLLPGCIGLALVARAMPERPLCALALVTAALGLALERLSPEDELPVLEAESDPLSVEYP